MLILLLRMHLLLLLSLVVVAIVVVVVVVVVVLVAVTVIALYSSYDSSNFLTWTGKYKSRGHSQSQGWHIQFRDQGQKMILFVWPGLVNTHWGLGLVYTNLAQGQ